MASQLSVPADEDSQKSVSSAKTAYLSQPYQDPEDTPSASPVVPPPSTGPDSIRVDRFVAAFGKPLAGNAGGALTESWQLILIEIKPTQQEGDYHYFESSMMIAIDTAMATQLGLQDGQLLAKRGVEYEVVIDLAYNPTTAERCDIAQGTPVYGTILKIQETPDAPEARQPTQDMRDDPPASRACLSCCFRIQAPEGGQFDLAIYCEAGQDVDNSHCYLDQQRKVYKLADTCDDCVLFSKNPGAIYKSGLVSAQRSPLNARSNKRVTRDHARQIRERAVQVGGKNTHPHTRQQALQLLRDVFGL